MKKDTVTRRFRAFCYGMIAISIAVYAAMSFIK